jgi:uncharacterized protein (TIGR03435 family)
VIPMKLLMVVTAVLWPAAAGAQTAPVSFDVATVRQHVGVSDSSRTSLRPGGRIEAENVSLLRMIVAAYEVTEQQVVDAPAWVEQLRWDLQAKAEGLPEKAQPEQVLPLLQGLLAERFGLRVRREKRPMPVYRLTVDKAGAKLPRAATEGTDSASTRNTEKGMKMEAQRMGMARFAQTLSRRSGRTVVDQTGLPGRYDFTLEWTPETAAVVENAGPSLFTAVREQLGLRLEAGREPVEVLVVEAVERPAEN